MIPVRLAERLKEMSQDPDKIYSTKTIKACLSGKKEVPWMKGFYFQEVDDDIPEENGMIMDAASFAPVIALNPKPNDRVLDMAAAPGMKTILIGKLMENTGIITACEINHMRIKRLRNNLSKFGCSICNTVRCDASRFKSTELFDKILLDAPCSGEGMVTKQKKLFKVWSEKRILRLQKMQKKLIKRGFELLKPGGIMIYSTCTFGPEENEQVIEWLVETHGAVVEKIDIPGLNYSHGIEKWNNKEYPNHANFLRVWPYQNNTNGMFVARIRKN